MPDRPRDRRPHGPRTAAAAVAALATALLAATVAGCGGGGTEGSTGTSASVSTTSTASTHASTTSTTNSSGATTTVKEVNHPSTPTSAVKLLLLSSNPRTGCSSDVVTSHYLHAAYGGRGACMKAVSPSSAAKSLGPGVAGISDRKATVVVHPVGGIYDGEKITVSLVRSSSGWKVDGIKSNAPVGP